MYVYPCLQYISRGTVYLHLSKWREVLAFCVNTKHSLRPKQTTRQTLAYFRATTVANPTGLKVLMVRRRNVSLKRASWYLQLAVLISSQFEVGAARGSRLAFEWFHKKNAESDATTTLLACARAKYNRGNRLTGCCSYQRCSIKRVSWVVCLSDIFQFCPYVFYIFTDESAV